MAQTEKPIVAAFDFDGTLTQRETLLPFLLHTLGVVMVVRHALILSPTLIGYGLGIVRNDVAKESVFTQCFMGMGIDDLRQDGERFAANVLPDLLRHEAMQRLEWHKQQGHRCVVISASLELYVRPWAIKAGFDDVIATHLETRVDGRISGKIAGANCYGIEKVRRLEAVLGSRECYSLYAYGDSRGDKELLSSSDYPYYRQIPNP